MISFRVLLTKCYGLNFAFTFSVLDSYIKFLGGNLNIIPNNNNRMGKFKHPDVELLVSLFILVA